MSKVMSSTHVPDVQPLADWFESHRRETVWLSVGLVALIALIDWRVGANVSLGALYSFPVILASVAMRRGGIVMFALVCAVLREAFGPFRWQPAYEIRLAMVGGALSGLGLLVCELNRNRRLVIANLQERERHLRAQQQSEVQLSTLVNTSPLPVLIADATGKIIVANEDCRALLAVSTDDEAANVFEYLPELRAVVESGPPVHQGMRREIECPGRKKSGEAFFAHVWTGAYEASSGMHLVVVLWDASEDLRGREMASADSIMTTSRVLLAGFAHEIRNIAAAAAVLSARLGERYRLGQDNEYITLTTTLQSLSELSASGLRLGSRRSEGTVDLGATMDQARIILQPMLDAAGVELVWDVPERLPRVRAVHSALIQVFVNLARNSETATRGAPEQEFRVHAVSNNNTDGVTITVCDNGPGVAHPEKLFQPFASDAGGAGLGLYVSRTMLRSFGGDLWYEPEPRGACFRMRLPVAAG